MPEKAKRTPEQRIMQLALRDIRVLGLLAEGYTNKEIADATQGSYGGVKSAVTRIKRKLETDGGGNARGERVVLALFYVEYVLKLDMMGTPLTSDKEAYTEPGEKLADWTKYAESVRSTLLDSGELTPRMAETVMLLTKPELAGLSDKELGQQLTPKFSATTVHSYFRMAYRGMERPGKPKLAVIASLAPFDIVARDKRFKVDSGS